MLAATWQQPWTKWCAAFLFWTIVGLIFSTQTYLYLKTQYENFQWLAALKNGMPLWYLWGALSPLIARLDRRLPLKREEIFKRILWHMPLGLLWVLAHFALRLGVEKIISGAVSLQYADLVGGFHMNIQIYWLIVGVYVAYDFFQTYRARELQASQLETRLSEARLQALRAQLQPHFLFNTLNAISAFMEKDPRTARQMLAHLGALLRFALEQDDKQEITLAEELALLENYLEIQRIRFADRLEIQMDIAPATLNARVPSLLLQPLVENAIKHGLAPGAAKGYVKIFSQQQNGDLLLQIRDNGAGLAAGGKKGIGLTNTEERLSRLYPQAHRFVIANASDGGVLVDIKLPFHIGG